jgi:hypothetical protein
MLWTFADHAVSRLGESAEVGCVGLVEIRLTEAMRAGRRESPRKTWPVTTPVGFGGD